MAIRFHIGCSGWQYEAWKGFFYPDTAPKSVWFSHYARQFNSVEINSTFYHFPQASTLEKWYAAAPQGFIYSLKAPRLITHYQKFIKTESRIEEFYAKAALLKEKLGCILFQFPASTHYHPDLLNRIVVQLDPTYQNVLEFRDKSWWRAEVYASLAEAHISFCHLSSPLSLPEIVVPSSHFYLRFHGPEAWFKGSHSEAELNTWIDKIKASPASDAWIYFNNTMFEDAIENARLFQRLVN